jgi:hypothetical protein
MKKCTAVVAVLAIASLTVARAASAQGGEASSTDAINGKISDTSAAILPGVTVTAASPSLMGSQVEISSTARLGFRFLWRL